jgi:hypothetical protein
MPAASTLTLPSSAAISFSDACLGDEGVRELVAKMSSRGDVTSLDLRGCHVNASGATALREVRTRMTSSHNLCAHAVPSLLTDTPICVRVLLISLAAAGGTRRRVPRVSFAGVECSRRL